MDGQSRAGLDVASVGSGDRAHLRAGAELAIKGLAAGREGPMVEISFYHHQTRRIEETLPILLERSLTRGWRAVVQATSETRLAALDQYLWSYRPESFLPHGTKRDASPETQSIYLTCAEENPNNADVRFFIEGAHIAPLLAGDAAPRQRAVLLFDGENPEELANARAQWKELRDAGRTLVYQQQDESGRWIEKAREPKAPGTPTR
jgi:DNA polymerase III subunit chi